MYIKIIDLKIGKPLVLNINIESYKSFFVENNYVYFSKGNKVFEKIPFASERDADIAMERIFQRLAVKQPISKILDLTKFEEEYSSDYVYLDINDIADKFKQDPSRVRIVSVSNAFEQESDEVELEEEIEDDDLNGDLDLENKAELKDVDKIKNK